MQQALPQIMQTTIREQNLLQPGDTVLVALSGGADSVALLRALLALERYTVLAAHLQHGIRGAEADRDAQYVEALCSALGVPLVLGQADVPALAAQTGESLEECARRVRYQFLEEAAAPRRAKIATAHTRDDNAETLLLHLGRGAGLRGLAGIPYRRGAIVRPLLDVPRAAVEAYLAALGQSFCTDSTNADLHYTRNLVRHTVLPPLRAAFPAFDEAAARCARSLREDADYLEAQAEAAWNRYQRGETDAAALAALPGALQSRAAAAAARSLCGREPDAAQIAALRRLLATGRGAVALPGGVSAVLRQGRLAAVPTKSAAPPDAAAPAPAPLLPPSPPDGAGRQPLPADGPLAQLLALCGAAAAQAQAAWRVPLWDGQWVDARIFPASLLQVFENCIKIHKYTNIAFFAYAIMDGNTFFRTRAAGDRIRPAGRGVTKPLRRWMQEQGIPAQRRDRVPVLARGSEILWVPGAGRSESGRPTAQDEAIVLLAWQGEPPC